MESFGVRASTSVVAGARREEAGERTDAPAWCPAEGERDVARGPICTFCNEKLASGSPFCAKCGHPTQWATHDDRVLWELGQWESSRKSDTATFPAAAELSPVRPS